ncbi:MAG: D-glycero-beta-D-manno-heptose 1-phosphate adenylyltransferase [Rhodanobacteraceae bacterium]
MSDRIRESDPDKLISLLGRARDLNVWVVGDIMLDEYAMGEVERISPEAPVPVLWVREVEYRLGGAANVAWQVAALGAHASLGGLVGEDAEGARILALCEQAGIDTRAVRKLDDRQTSRKLRALARHQQLVRLDWEHAAPCPSAAARWMTERLERGPAPDAIILSDYAKGVLTPEFLGVIAASVIPHGVRIVVDPKRPDFTAYRGASVITPNLRELEIAAGRAFDPADTESIATAARSLAREAGIEALIVTRGERGMLVVPAREPWMAIPARARAIFDTTGAGDTVVALLAILLACGASLGEAAHVANVAAGIVVGKVGTDSAVPGEIAEALRGGNTHKILDRAEVVASVGRWRAAGNRIVFTNGCFDLLHAGHLSLLHQAARCGDKLVLAINSDTSVQRLKGQGRPVVPQHERAAMLAALTCVDAVTIFDEDTPLETIQAVRPDVLVKGQDYRIEQVVGRDVVDAAGGEIVLVPLLPERSTTALIERITTGVANASDNPRIDPQGGE